MRACNCEQTQQKLRAHNGKELNLSTRTSERDKCDSNKCFGYDFPQKFKSLRCYWPRTALNDPKDQRYLTEKPVNHTIICLLCISSFFSITFILMFDIYIVLDLIRKWSLYSCLTHIVVKNSMESFFYRIKFAIWPLYSAGLQNEWDSIKRSLLYWIIFWRWAEIIELDKSVIILLFDWWKSFFFHIASELWKKLLLILFTITWLNRINICAHKIVCSW